MTAPSRSQPTTETEFIMIGVAELATLRAKAAKYDKCSAKIDCISRAWDEPQQDWNYPSQPGKRGGPSTKD